MRRLAIVAAMVVLAGCSDSHDSSVAEPSTGETVELPQAYVELMAGLPALDEPASAEVTEYRIATLEAGSERCARRSGGADKAVFRRANAVVLASAGTAPGTRLVSELAV